LIAIFFIFLKKKFLNNSRFFIVFIILFFIFSCNDNKDKNLNLSQSNNLDSLQIYISNIEKNKTNNKLILQNSKAAYNYIIKKNNNNADVRNKLLIISENFSKIKNENYLNKSAKLLLNKSIDGSDTINIANSYYLLANLCFSNYVNDSAYYYYLKSEKFFLDKKDKKNNWKLGNIYLNKSLIQLNINDLYGAEYSATLSLKYLKENKDVLGQYDAFTNLGIIANESENFEKAIEYHSEALNIAQMHSEYDNYFLKEVSLNNIGNTYQNSENFEEAILEFEKALSNKKLLNSKPSLYATLIDNIAYSKFKLNDFKELPNLFFKSLKIRDSLKLYSKVIFNKIHLSEYYFYKKDSIASKKYAREALRISRKTKSPLDILASLKQLSIVDKNKSTSFSKEYYRINDSLQVVERNSKNRFARIQFETDELRQENTALTVKNKNILNYFYVFVFLGSILFFVRWLRMRSREMELKQAQQQANEEIYRLIISHQNKLDEGKDLEKKRISKELHDGILGRLFGLRLNLDGLNSFDDDYAKNSRLDYLNELKVIEQDLREISHELSRENLAVINNFLAIINNLLDQQSKVNSAAINTFISDKINWDEVSNIRKINIYRILQEALQNINKYANAKNINIKLDVDKDGNFSFIIEDDGNGFNLNSKKNKGIGTKNMLQRTQQCNGTIEFKSEIKKGTKIIINFPPENIK
jgi:signal transduction histidine kinase